MEIQNTKPHIVLIVTPGMGHLIPVLEFAKYLVTVQIIKATIFIIKDKASSPVSQYLQSQIIPNDIHIVELSPPDPSGLISSKVGVARIVFTIKASLPAIRSAITAMSPRPKTLIVDTLSMDAYEIAEELKMTKYVYYTASATVLAFVMHLPISGKETGFNFGDLTESVKIPGCKPIPPEDIPHGHPALDRNNELHLFFIELCSRYRMADGILVNSWEDLEPISLNALKYNEVLRERLGPPPIFTVGPNVRRPVSNSATRSECLVWLDLQPSESVLFVSFGSYGTISADQVTELAWGLELSQQRFIWVLRPPSNDDSSEYLPDGFLTRTRGMGLVVSEWAPQEEILGHESMGGFLSHCGWNSCLESIVNGVPMIVWPLHADQKINASMLVEDLGVAVRAKVKQINGVVGREEIERMVRLIIKDEEGKKLRCKVRDLKNSAIEALGEGGSSYNALCQVAKEWK